MMTATPDVADAIRRAALSRGASEDLADDLAESLRPEPFLDSDGDIAWGVIDNFMDVVVTDHAPARALTTGREAYLARHGDPNSATEQAAVTNGTRRRQGDKSKDDQATSSTAPKRPDSRTLAAGKHTYEERHAKRGNR